VPFLTGAPELWATLASPAGFPSAFDWPLVIIGTSWWGATLALICNKWGWPVALGPALLSLLHAWEVTLMAVVVLVLLSCLRCADGDSA
jgi:hypothetical protein